jgi:hypothetical protein
VRLVGWVGAGGGSGRRAVDVDVRVSRGCSVVLAGGIGATNRRMMRNGIVVDHSGAFGWGGSNFVTGDGALVLSAELRSRVRSNVLAQWPGCGYS